MHKLAVVALVSVVLAGCGSGSDQSATTSSSSTPSPASTAVIDAATLAATKQVVTKDAPGITALSAQPGNPGVVAKDGFGPTATGTQISGEALAGFLAFTSTPGLDPLLQADPAEAGGGYMHIGREYDPTDTTVVHLMLPDAASGATRQARHPVALLVSAFLAGTTSGGITVSPQFSLITAPETAAQAGTWRTPRNADGISAVMLDSSAQPPVVGANQAIEVPAESAVVFHHWHTADSSSQALLYLQDLQGDTGLCTLVMTPDITARMFCDVWSIERSQWVFVGHVVIDLAPDQKSYQAWFLEAETTQGSPAKGKAVEGEVTVKGASGKDLPGQIVNGMLKLQQQR